MRILWLTWKDRKHPLTGGAEVVNEELAKRLVRDGHEVIFLVGGFNGATEKETRDGFSIIRVGRQMSVYWAAYRYYKKHLNDWPDLVIDEMNTIPFFAKFYVKQKNIMFVHQLCREIWFYEILFPLNVIGYLLEPLYLWMLSDRKVITISESTKQDLMRYGFKSEKIHIISEGIEITPLFADEFARNTKHDMQNPMILSIGRIEPMKRTVHIIRAFEMVKKNFPTARLVIVGLLRKSYGKRVQRLCAASSYSKDITITGVVPKEKKIELMREATVLAFASVKEGWGLVVTEANSQGTPAVVYNADGLRDSVRDNVTGLLCSSNTPENLTLKIQELLTDPEKYARLRADAWQWSKEMTFDKSYEQLVEIITTI